MSLTNGSQLTGGIVRYSPSVRLLKVVEVLTDYCLFGVQAVWVRIIAGGYYRSRLEEDKALSVRLSILFDTFLQGTR